MNLENRYLVMKRKDLICLDGYEQEMLDKIAAHINEYRTVVSGRKSLECVVVESDWPEYEPTCYAIKNRILESEGHSAHCAARQTWGDGECECGGNKKLPDPPTINSEDHVQAVCMVLPTGETLWFDAEKGQAYMSQVLDKWRREHPEFIDTGCTMGAVHIRMPRDKYIAIGAQFGPGSFAFP